MDDACHVLAFSVAMLQAVKEACGTTPPAYDAGDNQNNVAKR
jgi:hypothetical protein